MSYFNVRVVSDSIDKKLAGVVVFHYPTGQVLLLKKHKRGYDLPKGHVDPGETLLHAALREAWEETGLLPSQDVVIYPNNYINIASKKDMRFYLGLTESNLITPSHEHAGYKWVNLQKAAKLLGNDNDLLIAVNGLSSFLYT